MNHAHLNESYDTALVVLSIIVAIIASTAALNIVNRVLHQLKRFTLFWIILGSLVEGLGIWTMHFIGMLAHQLPVPVSYDVTLLVASMLLPICSSFAALWIVTRKTSSTRRWVLGGFFMSAAIAGMHYTGMEAIIAPAEITYDPYLVLLSILIALVISFTALRLYFKSSSRRMRSREKLIGGTLLGAAIASMHYTGMAASNFNFGSDGQHLTGNSVSASADHFALVIWVSAAALLMLLLILLSRTIESRIIVRMAKWGERRYYFMFERSPDLVGLFDIEGKLLQANPSVSRVSGFSSRDLIRMNPIAFVVPADRKKAEAMFKRTATGVSQTGELAISHKNGGTLYLSVTMIPLIVSGKIVDIYMIAQDITQRKHAKQQLIYNEARLEEVQSIAKIGSWDWNRQTGMYKWSDGLYRIFDVDSCESPLRRPFIVERVHPEDREMFKRHMRRALATNEKGRLEFRMLPPDGVMKYCYCEYCTEADGSGQAIRKYGFIQNITDRKLLELQLYEANQAKSRFLSGVIHEIRTQLNAIAGLSHLLQRTDLTEKQQDYMGIIQSASKSIRSIINNNLDYSKIEFNMLDLEKSVFSLESVLKDVADVVALRAAEKNIELFLFHDRSIPYELLGDPMRLGQVLTNLVDNAVKFTNKGKIVVRTTLHSRTTDSTAVHFSVKDEGIGITDAQIKTLFEPFVQAESSTTRKYGGTGLGLPISQRLVERMNGEIVVHSKPDQGSEFSFTAQFGTVAETSPRPKTAIHNQLHIIVISSNEDVNHFIAEALQEEGHMLTMDRNGEQTLEGLASSRSEHDACTDLIILDWEHQSDAELGARMSVMEQARGRSMNIIVMLNYLQRDQLHCELDSWPAQYLLLPKPLVNLDLLTAVQQVSNASLHHCEGEQEEEFTLPKPSDEGGLTDYQAPVRLFIVEDLELNRVILQEILKPYAAHIETAADGLQAIERFADKRLPAFDLILIDLHMPGLDGYETTKMIRQYDRHIPIIAVSANAFIWEKHKCKEAGIDDYIGKPIDPQQLLQTVHMWLQTGSRRRGEEELDKPKIQAAAALLNDSSLLERLGGDVKILEHIYNIFYKEQKETAVKLQQLIKAQDWAGLQLLLHNLKGAASNMSMDQLAALAKQLEERLRHGETEQMKDEMVLLITMLNEVCTRIAARLVPQA